MTAQKITLLFLLVTSLVGCKGFESNTDSGASVASEGDPAPAPGPAPGPVPPPPEPPPPAPTPAPTPQLKVTITKFPASASDVAAPIFEFKVENAVGDFTLTCELNGAGLDACASPQTVNLVDSGSYTFKVSAVDSEGSIASASHAWTYTKPPPPPPASDGMAELDWDPNTESDLAGYTIYYGTTSKNYTSQIDIGITPLVGGKVVHTITNLPAGKTYYFTVKARGKSGVESVFSAEVSKAIP